MFANSSLYSSNCAHTRSVEGPSPFQVHSLRTYLCFDNGSPCSIDRKNKIITCLTRSKFKRTHGKKGLFYFWSNQRGRGGGVYAVVIHHTHIHTYTHTFTHSHIHVHTHTHIYITHTYKHIHTRVHHSIHRCGGYHLWGALSSFYYYSTSRLQLFISNRFFLLHKVFLLWNRSENLTLNWVKESDRESH